MKKKIEHTPTPWKYGEKPAIDYMVGANRESVGYLEAPKGSDSLTAQAKANKDFILRAVNAHEELVKALRSVIQEASTDALSQETWDEIRNALTKAEGIIDEQ